jgi:hypothetical protein
MLAVPLHGDDVAPRFRSANQFMIAELDGGHGPAWPAAVRRGRRPRHCSTAGGQEACSKSSLRNK